MTSRDREHAARMLEKAEEIRVLARRGRFPAEPATVERVHLRAIFIAESADHLSRSFKSKSPTLWTKVRNFRTAALHTYETMDPETLAAFVRDDLPAIVAALRRARFGDSAAT